MFDNLTVRKYPRTAVLRPFRSRGEREGCRATYVTMGATSDLWREWLGISSRTRASLSRCVSTLFYLFHQLVSMTDMLLRDHLARLRPLGPKRRRRYSTKKKKGTTGRPSPGSSISPVRENGTLVSACQCKLRQVASIASPYLTLPGTPGRAGVALRARQATYAHYRRLCGQCLVMRRELGSQSSLYGLRVL